MKKQIERRRQSRELLATSEVGILYPEPHKEGIDSLPEEKYDTLLVHVLNLSEGGALLESFQGFIVGSAFDLWLPLSHKKLWMVCKGQVIWVDESPTKRNHYLLGVQFQTATRYQEVPRYRVIEGTRRMYPSDLEFLMHTKLFEAIPQEAKCPLLNRMNPKNVKAGERLIC